MKSAVQLIVLLNCIFLCTSQKTIMRCRCINTIPAVRHHLIADVKVYELSPACRKREVIVVRKDNREFCLNPESNFTKKLLETMKKLSTTTTAATTQSTARATSSVTNQ